MVPLTKKKRFLLKSAHCDAIRERLCKMRAEKWAELVQFLKIAFAFQ